MGTTPAPLSKDDWVFAFTMEVVRVRPGMSYGRAEERAKDEWRTRARIDPRQAARRWLAERGSAGD